MNEIRRERNRDLFIQIAYDIIQKDGMEAATIRNIAKVAGYNSATLYSYFDNQAHIIFCAYMRFEEDLMKVLQSEVAKNEKPLHEIWAHMYGIVAKYYFDNPNVFDCTYVSVYDKDGGLKRQKQREKDSVLDEYLLSCLHQIAQECSIPMGEAIRIHLVCFSYTIGTILLALKERVGAPTEEILQRIERDAELIIEQGIKKK